MSRDFCVRVGAKKVNVVIDNYSGLYIPGKADPHIIVYYGDDELSKSYMDSFIHEVCHHVLTMYKIDNENRVRALTKWITEILWARGYRLPAKRRKKSRRSSRSS